MTDLSRRSLAAGGALLLAGTALQSINRGAKFSETVLHLPFQLGSVLLMAASLALLAAIHDMARDTRRVPSAATALAAIGTTLWFGLSFAQAFVNPAIAKAAPQLLDGNNAPASMTAGWLLAGTGFALAWLCYAIALLRSGTCRTGPAVALIIGSVATLVPFLPGAILLGAALAWLGLAPHATPARQAVPEAA